MSNRIYTVNTEE
uniref:Uncharacterized protein n=1 Tax=Anguilla anguilla TaxID=7936 RepID=A0A0E9PFC4_ANGAN